MTKDFLTKPTILLFIHLKEACVLYTNYKESIKLKYWSILHDFFINSNHVRTLNWVNYTVSTVWRGNESFSICHLQIGLSTRAFSRQMYSLYSVALKPQTRPVVRHLLPGNQVRTVQTLNRITLLLSIKVISVYNV